MRLQRKMIMLFTAVTASLLLSACNQPASNSAPQSFAAPSVASPAVIVISAVTQPPPPPPTPTPTPIPTPTPVPTPFSIVWLADTQTLTMHQPEALTAMGKWIADNAQAKNIVCVVQTGDSVENGFNPRYWENFDCCYLQFADRLPYVPVAGNHDIAVQRHSYEAFLARPYFSAFPPDALFENSKALYYELNAGGMKLLLIGAGWETEESAADWMVKALAEHADDIGVLLFHGYVQSDGRFTVMGKKMFEQVIVPSPNVRLVLCGHVSGEVGTRLDEVDDDGDGTPDRFVRGLMYNYQRRDFPEIGQLRLLTFDPMAHTLQVFTYSPFSGKAYKDRHFGAADFTLQDAF